MKINPSLWRCLGCRDFRTKVHKSIFGEELLKRFDFVSVKNRVCKKKKDYDKINNGFNMQNVIYLNKQSKERFLIFT